MNQKTVDQKCFIPFFKYSNLSSDPIECFKRSLKQQHDVSRRMKQRKVPFLMILGVGY